MSQIHKLSMVPSVSTYVMGLTAIRSRMNDIQHRLLVTQYNAPNRAITAKQLAMLAKVEGGHLIVNHQYGRLGHLFCDATGVVPDVRPDNTYRWWAIWSLGYSTRDGFVWQMLPEVAEALESLQWVTEPFRLAEEVINVEKLIEGAVSQITINAYERNVCARTKCIQHYGYSCVICGFNFGSVYGSIAEKIIHVHHVKALSEIGQQYEVDPINDLRPVCPNCHAVIHQGGQTRSIDEVKALLKNRL